MAMPLRDDTIEAIKRLEPTSRVRCGMSGALVLRKGGGRGATALPVSYKENAGNGRVAAGVCHPVLLYFAP